MTLGQRDNRPEGELIAALVGQVPAELVPEGNNGRRGLVRIALRELASEDRIVRTGKRDEDVVRLMPAPPDPRFERDEQLRLLLPYPAPGAVAALERKLVTEGCRQDLYLWQEPGSSRVLPLLADGYHRDDLFRRHRLPFTVSLLPDLPDRRALEAWLWRDHYGRRSMLRAAQSYARGRWFNSIKAARGGDRRPDRLRRPTEVAHAAQVVARADGVSERAVYADGRFAEALDKVSAVCGPELVAALLGEVVKLGRPDVLLLAALPPEKMRPLADRLLGGKPVRLRPARKREQLVLPLGNLPRMAEILLGRLGDEDFDQMCAEAAVLRRQAQEEAS